MEDVTCEQYYFLCRERERGRQERQRDFTFIYLFLNDFDFKNFKNSRKSNMIKCYQILKKNPSIIKIIIIIIEIMIPCIYDYIFKNKHIKFMIIMYEFILYHPS